MPEKNNKDKVCRLRAVTKKLYENYKQSYNVNDQI